MAADPAYLRPAVEAAYPGASITLIGCGGFACTFRVEDGNTVMAVKVLDPTKVNTIREDREVLALQSVNDSRVVQYQAAASVDVGGETFRYLAMAFVEGTSLKEMLQAGHQFSLGELADLAEDITHGAAAIWAAGLAHRDFNPGNVLVTQAGRGVIVDLGIARHMNLPTITTTVPFAGAPGWMAPEQVSVNPQRGDWRSDQFVIGLLLYRIATGVEPYAERELIKLWHAPANKRLLPARHVNPGLPRAIAAVIDTLTAPDAGDRYAQPADLLDAVDLAVNQLRGAPTPSGAARPTRFYVAVGNVKNYLSTSFLQSLAPDGVVLDARNVVPGDVATWVSGVHGVGSTVLLDPVTPWDQSPVAARPEGYKKLAWGNGAQVTAPFPDDAAREAYARPVVNAQQSAGADAIIAPYLYADATRTDLLEESLRLGGVARRIVADAGWTLPVWTGLAIADAWARRAMLPTLLTHVTRYSPSTLYLLVSTTQSTAQPLGDEEVLLGLRALIERVNAYGGEVIVGRRYVSGLLLCALGAAGWATGSSGTHHTMFVPPAAVESSGGGPAADWYYVPGLLNSIKIATRAGLLARHATLLAPTDPYDTALFAGNPALATIGNNTQQRIELEQHNIFAVRQIAGAFSAMSEGQRITTMRALVLGAQANYQAIGAGLDPGEGGDFLNAWLAVL